MKKKKIVISLLMFITLIGVLNIRVEASSFTFPSWSQIQSSAQNFLSTGSNTNVTTSNLQNIFLPMAQILLGIAIFVLIGVTIVMGIKYMLATPEEAAKLKQQLVGLVVSAVVIFAAVGIWTLLYNVLSAVL